MNRLFLLSFLVITLLFTCSDDDGMMQPIEDVRPLGLGIFECSEWETIDLDKSFARRVEDRIFMLLLINGSELTIKRISFVSFKYLFKHLA